MSKNFNKTEKTISSYWTRKEERKKQAERHNTEMSVLFPNEIQKSIDNSKAYGEVPSISGDHTPLQFFSNIDSVGAVFDVYDPNKKICVLNFASYKHPGGGFLSGSSAQEESLCHESTLYNVLSANKFKEYYDWNNKNKNRGLYLNRAIYSPNVIFIRDKKIEVDVLTCAAPNFNSAGKYEEVSEEENYEILKNRMQFISSILNDNKVQVFIAGAYGCGVFGQDPNEVAQIWKSELVYGPDLEKIVHSVPFSDENTEVFREAFPTFTY